MSNEIAAEQQLQSLNERDLKVGRTTSDSEEEDSKSTGADLIEDDNVVDTKPGGTWETFIGKERKTLYKEPIVFNEGLGAFGTSLGKRMKAVFTKRLLICIIAGQLLSVAITSTSVLTTELILNNWSMPTFQSFFLYFFLNLIYTPYTIYRYGWKAYGKMLITDGWKYCETFFRCELIAVTRKLS